MLRHSFISLARSALRAPLVLPPAGRYGLLRCLASSASRPCAVPPADDPRPSVDPAGGRPAGSDDRSQRSDRAEREAQLRSRVLEASLLYVPEHGWSTDALAAGAESLGLADVAHGVFPRGGIELVDYFYSSCNARLAADMAARRAAEEALDPAARTGTQAFIRWAVERRLRMVTPYLEQWPEALALLALPANAAGSLANLGTLLDDIWYHAGDRSSDFNWYTKRGILAAVYKATELRLLTDTSDDWADTWAFLDRRLENATAAGRCVRQLREAAPAAARSAGIALSTAANMMGLNSRR